MEFFHYYPTVATDDLSIRVMFHYSIHGLEFQLNKEQCDSPHWQRFPVGSQLQVPTTYVLAPTISFHCSIHGLEFQVKSN